jgi:hypothetical protein
MNGLLAGGCYCVTILVYTYFATRITYYQLAGGAIIFICLLYVTNDMNAQHFG